MLLAVDNVVLLEVVEVLLCMMLNWICLVCVHKMTGLSAGRRGRLATSDYPEEEGVDDLLNAMSHENDFSSTNETLTRSRCFMIIGW